MFEAHAAIEVSLNEQTKTNVKLSILLFLNYI
jgi:hypothetical protein